MPAWAWWGLISVGLLALGWRWGRRSRPLGPAGHVPCGTSWAVYFSPHGGVTDAILAAIRGAKRTILVAGVYTENSRRHAHHSTPYRRTVPWRTYIRAVWASLTRRRRKRWGRDLGEDG